MSQTRNTGFLTNIIQYTPSGNISFVSGSTTLMSISSSGAITTTGVISGSTALSASNALSSSFSLTGTTAATASSITNLNQNVVVTGSLTTTGQIVAQTLNVQQVTSSIVYSSGSNIFGNSLSNTQQFTGSVLVTGSIGIGVIPSANQSPLLQIYNPSAATRIRLQYYSASAGAIDFYSGSTEQWSIVVDNNQTYGKIENRTLSTDAIRFYNSTNNVILNPTAGSVGIGITSPTSKLHIVNNTDGFVGRFTGGSSSNIIAGIYANTALSFASIGVQSAHDFRIFTNDTDKLTVTAAGNVGIGTTVPAANLHILGSANFVTQNIQNSTAFYALYRAKNSAISAYWQWGCWTDGTFRLGQDGVADYVTVTTGGQFISYNSVKVQSGTGGSSAGLIVRPSDNTDESTFFGKESYWTLIGANSNEGWKFRGSNGTNAFLVNAGSFSYNATLLGSLTQNASDIRLKTNITKIENALEKISTLEGFTYNWKEECPLYNPNSELKEVGVSAQAVQEILPEVVSLAGFDRDNDDQTKSKSGQNYLTVQYEKLVPLLIEGIKELKAENDSLKEILQRNNIQ